MAGLHNPASVRCPHLPSGAVWPHSQLQRNTHSVSLTRFKGKLLWPGKWFSWVAVTIHETTSSLLFSSYKKVFVWNFSPFKTNFTGASHHDQISIFDNYCWHKWYFWPDRFAFILLCTIFAHNNTDSQYQFLILDILCSFWITQYCCLAASDFSCLCNLCMYVGDFLCFPLLSFCLYSWCYSLRLICTSLCVQWIVKFSILNIFLSAVD